MKRIIALSVATLLSNLAAGQETIEEIVVTADFYHTSALRIPSSVSVLDEAAIQQRHAENLEQLLGLVPNVNYATGASRGRFIQIRGIGERSEFIEPVNFSVGVLIDGIDFTGISTAATTLDIKQVEILRGPQGTLHGANALAGLINLVSADPTETTEGNVEATIGNYDSRVIKGAIGGSLSDNLGYRIAGQITQSDGFITNTYLHKDDVQNLDETTLRGKFALTVSDNLDLGLTLIYVDIDNGYDAYSYESNRKTRSNQPGHDRQETTAFALSAGWALHDSLSLEGLVSHADSEIEYGYDEDWRNPQLCLLGNCVFGPDGYHSAFDNYQRANKNDSIDVRLKSNFADTSSNWVLGVYYRDQEVDFTRTYTSGFGSSSDVFFTSRYKTKNTAIYGNWTQMLNDQLSLSIGARFEDRDADYLDSDSFGFSTGESLWGGKLSLSYQLNSLQMAYVTISRGYKAGGANSNSSVPDSLREYDTETILNYEIGFKGVLLDGKLEAQISVFYQDRDDIQTDSAIVDCPGPGEPCRFDDYLTNAANGENYGLEAQVRYAFSNKTSLYGSLGLLNATFGTGYINYQHVDADETTGDGVDMDGRNQPHAPDYQFLIGVTSALTETLSLDFNLEGKDNFLFGNDHDARSSSYVLVNANFSYEVNNWQISIWGKNLTDKNYQNRAFGTFPNDPRDGYSTFGPYYQLSDPRTFGITGRYNF